MPTNVYFPETKNLCTSLVGEGKSWQQIKSEFEKNHVPSAHVIAQPLEAAKNTLNNGLYGQYKHSMENAKKFETEEDRTRYEKLLKYIDEVCKQDLRAQEDLRKLGEVTTCLLQELCNKWKQKTESELKKHYRKTKGKSYVKTVVIVVVVIGVLCLAGYLGFSLLKAIFSSWFS